MECGGLPPHSKGLLNDGPVFVLIVLLGIGIPSGKAHQGSTIPQKPVVTGGAFGFKLGSSQIEQILTNISIVHWGSDGLNKLADGSTDIVQNLLVLAAVGAVLFSISLLRFMYREF